MKKRTGDPWMPADAFGRTLTGLSLNLVVRDIARSLPFYAEVLGLRALYADADFAALAVPGPGGARLMLHADHTYDGMPTAVALASAGPRGVGAELRIMGLDPDGVQARAEATRAPVLVPARDFPHGWRECHVEDPDGYVWAVGVALPDSRTTAM